MILTSLDDVRPGMSLGVGLHNREGYTLLGPGVVLTDEYIGRLRDLGWGAVWIDDPDTRDIPYEHVLSESTRLATTTEILNTFALTARETADLRSASTREIRAALKSPRFQGAYEDHPAVQRLLGQVDIVVTEVLDRPVLTGLGSLRSHDSYTFQHCLDVTATATVLGRLAGYDRPTLRRLAVGCILHDIGRVFLDDTLLGKRGPLNPEETRRIQEHTVLGYLFLRDTLRIGVLAAHVAYQHHERQDGTGYPRGLTGANHIVHGLEIHVPGQITPLAEIAAIANFHDSHSTDRPYRKAAPPDQVWQMIRDGAGTRFNRELVEVFLSVLPPFPVGSRVVVKDGEWEGHTGVVVRLGREDKHRPVVRLLSSAGGDRIEPFEIDLGREGHAIAGIASLEPVPA